MIVGDNDPGLDEASTAEALGAKPSPDEATCLLALPVPAEAEVLHALLQRQFRAAQMLEDRPRQLALAKLLTEAQGGRPNGDLKLNAQWVLLAARNTAAASDVGDALKRGAGRHAASRTVRSG